MTALDWANLLLAGVSALISGVVYGASVVCGEREVTRVFALAAFAWAVVVILQTVRP